MSQLKDEILNTIADCGQPSISIPEICESVQCPADIVQDCLADMQWAGSINTYEENGKVVVCLSSLEKNNRGKKNVGAVSICSSKRIKKLDIRDWPGNARFDQFSLPYPTSFLGMGCALWDNIHHSVCPGCKGKELESYEYCLRCDRWGLDNTKTVVIDIYNQHPANYVDVKSRIEKVNGFR